MQISKIALSVASAAALLCANIADAGQTYNFSDLGVAPNSNYDSSQLQYIGDEDQSLIDMMGEDYGSGFYHSYNTYGGLKYGALYNGNPYLGTSWHGFAWSSRTDTTTQGVDNQYSAITGSGYNGSQNYLVFYGDGIGMGYNNFTDDGIVTLSMSSPDTSINGIYITNTAYTYYSMKNGDGYNTAFAAGDYLKLIIYGYNLDGSTLIDSTSILLGDGTNLLDQWTYIDIANSIGADVQLLSFGFEQYTAATGKTVSNHGCKAPIYFALGGVETAAVPEAADFAAIFGVAALAFVFIRRRK